MDIIYNCELCNNPLTRYIYSENILECSHCQLSNVKMSESLRLKSQFYLAINNNDICAKYIYTTHKDTFIAIKQCYEQNQTLFCPNEISQLSTDYIVLPLFEYSNIMDLIDYVYRYSKLMSFL